jgi:aryl-alcohol dehydrogenase-like predicted oxidoreductase
MFAIAMGNAPEDSARIIHKALDAGINLIDTAGTYGDAEDVVGAALKGCRDDVVLATKFGGPVGEGPNRQGASRRWIVTAVERRSDVGTLDQAYQPPARQDPSLRRRSPTARAPA